MSNSDLLARGLRLLLRDPSKFLQRLRQFLHGVRKEYRPRLNMRLADWLEYHQKNIVFERCYWMGVHAFKNPLDAWIYQEIIYNVRPDVIIEIGSAAGGSTLYIAHLLDLIGNGSVISIDIDRSKWQVNHNRIIAITGNSSDQSVLDQIRVLCSDKSVLVIHDGNHRKQQVIQDLEAYSPLVSKGSYFIIEDGIIDVVKPGGTITDGTEGPLAAVEEFLRRNNSFVVDEECERYLLTSNPKGYLKRVS